MVRTCLGYLSFDELLLSSSKLLSRDLYAKHFEVLHSKYHLLEYAATYWGDHLRTEYPWMALGNRESTSHVKILPTVLEFLKKDFRLSDIIVHNASHHHGQWIQLSASSGGPAKCSNVRYDTS